MTRRGKPICGCKCRTEVLETFTINEEQRAFNARRHAGVKCEVGLPLFFDPVSNEPQEGWVKFGFGCDPETGDDAALTLKVSRILGEDFESNWKAALWSSPSFSALGTTFTYRPRSFYFELELSRGEEVLSTVVVPVEMGDNVSGNVIGRRPRTFSGEPKCRVFCRRWCGEVFIEAHLHDALNDSTVGTADIPGVSFRTTGVRHCFEPVEVEEWGEGCFVESDKEVSGKVVAFSVVGEIEVGMPEDFGGFCPEELPPAEEVPYIQLNQCEFGRGGQHVPDAIVESNFTKLKIGLTEVGENGAEHFLTLTNKLDDGSLLANNTFTYTGPFHDYDRVEASAGISVLPGHTCGYPGGGPVLGHFSVLMTLAIRFCPDKFFSASFALWSADGANGSTPGVAPSLSITSCFGSGASAIITAPSFEDQPSPITGVKLMSGGSGYAALHRVEPSITVSGTSGEGTGATFSVTLTETKDKCGLPTWGIATIESTGGSGYSPGDTLTLTPGEGVVTLEPAVATIDEPRGQPTLTATGSGTGADLDITYIGPIGPPSVWSVGSISVGDGGSDYSDGESVVFELGEGDTEVLAASATINTKTGQPTLTATVSGGTGAELEIQYYSHPNALEGWYGVEQVIVNNGGTGYTDGASVTFTMGDNDELKVPFVGAAAFISADANGTITSITRTNRGVYRKDFGEIESVTVNVAGEYYKGTAGGVAVTTSGAYYTPDSSLDPYVADIEIEVVQTPPMDGSGATFTATVDDDVESETFGQIIALEIEDGGDGYEVLQPEYGSQKFLSGEEITTGDLGPPFGFFDPIYWPTWQIAPTGLEEPWGNYVFQGPFVKYSWVIKLQLE